MGRKRKLFTGIPSIGGPKLKSRREARKITSKFHILNNKKEIIIKEKEENKKENENENNKLKLVEDEINKLGGRNRYQQASVISTSYHKTSKWIISNLKKLGIYYDNKLKQLNTLEIGAINIQLHQYSGLNVRSIDVNSQHRLIEELDFFEIIPEGKYDLIICSMVVNCVPSEELRGEMLARLSLHLKPMTGILCLVLPTRCVIQSNSSFSSSPSSTTTTSPNDSLFRFLLQSFNLTTPTIERFPALNSDITSSTLPTILTRYTPKLSFYFLMHSTSTPISNKSFNSISTSSLRDINDWILTLPLEKQLERSIQEESNDNDNIDESKEINQSDKTLTSNTIQNCLSLLNTIFTTFSSQNQQIEIFLSENGKEMIRQYYRRQDKKNKKRKLVSIDTNIDDNNSNSNINENKNQIINKLGLDIIIPDKLIHLLLH